MSDTKTTQEIKAGVPKPDNAGTPFRVKAKTPRNLRNGPGTEYIDQGVVGKEEIFTGDEILIYDNTGRVATDGTVWKWVDILTGKYGGRSGWIQSTNFSFEKLATKPIPPVDPPAPEPPAATVSLDSTTLDTAPAVITPGGDAAPKQETTQFIINVTRVQDAFTVTVTSDNEAAVERILTAAVAILQIARPLIKLLVKYEPIIDDLKFSFSGKENQS